MGTLFNMRKKDRGAETKEALIQSGIQLFSECGIKATTTRMLADKAGVNISAIAYHFAGKEGLYGAVIRYIGERISENNSSLIEETRYMLEESIKKGEHPSLQLLTEEAQKLALGMAQLIIGTSQTKVWVQLIMREQANPTKAFDSLYNGPMRDMQMIFSELISLAIGRDKEDDEVKIRCQIIWGQILGFRVARESFLRHLGVNDINPNQLAVIYKLLSQQISTLLISPDAEDRNHI